MRYLFFDIECVHEKNVQYMLSFGYVITDEDFNVIEKEDVLINPNLPFSLTDVGVPVYYSIREILNSPIFPDVYNKIKELLEDKSYYVIGHAIINDVQYLIDECISYELDGFNFEYYDAQLIYCYLNNETRRVSLDNILVSYAIERSNLHRSDEDAYHTMIYLKSICNQKGMTLKDLIKDTKAIPGVIKGKETLEPFMLGWIHPSCNSIEFKQIALNVGLTYLTDSNGGKLNGKTFGINSKILYHDLNFSLWLINQILSNGGSFSLSLDVDYFIHEYNDCPYQEKLSINESWCGDFIDIKELYNYLGINEEDVETLSKDYFERLVSQEVNIK